MVMNCSAHHRVKKPGTAAKRQRSELADSVMNTDEPAVACANVAGQEAQRREPLWATSPQTNSQHARPPGRVGGKQAETACFPR